MPNTLDSIKYVKYNKARLKAGKRNGNKSMLLEYFKEHEGKVRASCLRYSEQDFGKQIEYHVKATR